jgi:hypothetical protein
MSGAKLSLNMIRIVDHQVMAPLLTNVEAAAIKVRYPW